MRLVRMVIQVTSRQKTLLRRLRNQGFTEAGYIRSLLERELRPCARPRRAKRHR